MTVAELKKRLQKAPDDIEVIIEADKGRKFHILTAKKRNISAGHRFDVVFWIATGKLKETENG